MTCRLTLLLEHHWSPAILQRHVLFDEFFLDCETGNLPAFSWLEPKYSGDGSDFHSPHNPVNAEHLVARIYNALRASSAWQGTLFILNFDECGGMGDPIVPPIAPEYHHHYGSQHHRPRWLGGSGGDPHLWHGHHPGGHCAGEEKKDESILEPSSLLADAIAICGESLQSRNPDEWINRPAPKHWSHSLGLRVPCLLIGSDIKGWSLDHTTYDHCSVLATLCEKFHLDKTRLGPRVAWSKSFWGSGVWGRAEKTKKTCRPCKGKIRPLPLPKWDAREYSGQSNRWSSFQEQMFNGLMYTLYTLEILGEAVLTPQQAMCKSWSWVSRNLQSLVKTRGEKRSP